MTLGRYYWSRR